MITSSGWSLSPYSDNLFNSNTHTCVLHIEPFNHSPLRASSVPWDRWVSVPHSHVWDWGSIEICGLRGRCVELPAQFTGVSLRMCAVCIAKPRGCQCETYGPFKSPHQKKNSIFRRSEIFFLLPLGSSATVALNVYIQWGTRFMLCWLNTVAVKYKILQVFTG